MHAFYHRDSASFPAAARATFVALCALLFLAVASPVRAEGDAAAGQAKAVTCAACHGVDGNSFNPEWPSLAGQHPDYLAKQLLAFKACGANPADPAACTRNNVVMMGQVMALTDQDIKDLSAYFARQKATPRTADPALVASGERLYRGGSKSSDVPACIACHGPTGRGNLIAGWPSVAGQHATYTAAQLTAYRSKQRTTDGDTQMMRNVASRLTDDEIRAVASYIQGLR
jgi:cytochrome c553